MTLRGGPDYGVWSPKHTVTALADMAELAARLGSIVTFDRRGDVVWLDDFEDNINRWKTLTTGTGGSTHLSTEAARSRARSAKLTTGNLAGNLAEIERDFPLPVPSRTGFELSFALLPNVAYIELWAHHMEGTFTHTPRIRYQLLEESLQLLDHTATWVTVKPHIPLLPASHCFHTLKLVYDIISCRYARILLNNLAIDVSQHTPRRVPDPTTPRLSIHTRIRAAADGGATAYIDDFILTQNEP